MKLCITSEGTTPDAAVDPRFGRCRYFMIHDTDTGAYEAVENGQAGFSGGAGIQSAQAVAGKGVSAVLTGNVGPNAFQALNAAGIRIYTGVAGTVAEAVRAYAEGKLAATAGPTAGPKSGTR
ncbi:MAG TPA: NifB/NifX family molybdenum-iron cluster-binding protein [bacterium]|nr:NifB/NifX family molybdenum-iron cluster-binding protein [bacterium]